MILTLILQKPCDSDATSITKLAALKPPDQTAQLCSVIC